MVFRGNIFKGETVWLYIRRLTYPGALPIHPGVLRAAPLTPFLFRETRRASPFTLDELEAYP